MTEEEQQEDNICTSETNRGAEINRYTNEKKEKKKKWMKNILKVLLKDLW